MELKTKLAKVISLVKQSWRINSTAQTAQSHQMSVADELANSLNSKSKGVITQAEFDKKRPSCWAKTLGILQPKKFGISYAVSNPGN